MPVGYNEHQRLGMYEECIILSLDSDLLEAEKEWQLQEMELHVTNPLTKQY